jgi:hypothetical protein
MPIDGAEVAQRIVSCLGCAKKQITVWFQRIMKSATDLFLQLPIEIDHHVAARDEIDVGKWRIFKLPVRRVGAPFTIKDAGATVKYRCGLSQCRKDDARTITTPFFMTSNEIRFLEKHIANYVLYRVFEFSINSGVGQFFKIKENIKHALTFEPINFRVRV